MYEGSSATIGLGPKATFASSVGTTSLRSDKKHGEDRQVGDVGVVDVFPCLLMTGSLDSICTESMETIGRPSGATSVSQFCSYC